MAKKLSEGQIDEIVTKYCAGLDTYGLGKEYGVHNSTVGNALKKRGVKLRETRRVAKLSASQVDEIVEKYLGGESTYELGKEYGVHRCTITEALMNRGVRLRDSSARAKRKLSEHQIDEIVEKHKTGKNSIELGREYGVNGSTISYALKSRGFKLREPVKELSETQTGEIVKKYVSGAKISELGRDYGINRSWVRKILKKNGVEIRPSWEEQRKLTRTEIDEIVEKYEAGEGSHTLGRKYGVNFTTILDALKARGITPRNSKPRKRVPETQIDEIVDRYQGGESTYELGREYGVHNTTIGDILRRRGVKIRPGWEEDDRKKLARKLL